MIRGFFAFLLFILFSILIIPGILVTGFLAPFLDKSNLQKNVVPQSYELVMSVVEKKITDEFIKGQALPSDIEQIKKIRSFLPKETYTDILSEGINDFYNGLSFSSSAGVSEIDFKNTKTKLISTARTAVISALTCGEGLSLKAKGFQCLPKNMPQKEKDRISSKITSDLDVNIPSRFTIPDPKAAMYLGVLSDVLKNFLLIEVCLLGTPVILFVLLGLLIYKPRSKIFKGLGKVSLSVSFESFVLFLGLSAVPDMVSRMGALPAEALSFVKFLLSFPIYRFQIMTIACVIIGVVLIFAGAWLLKKNQQTEDVNKPIFVRNGKLRKGSTWLSSKKS